MGLEVGEGEGNGKVGHFAVEVEDVTNVNF